MIWDEIEATAKMLGTNRKMVLREEIQKAVLTALALQGCFNTIVFQGGTALRLFHGNPRFSEDIDLVLNHTKESSEMKGDVLRTVLASSLPGVERSVKDTFPFITEVEFRTQKNNPDLLRYILMTRSDNPEHSLRIHIELAAIPSYRNTPRILNFPPVNPAIRVEDTVEILADKVCALALRPYLKGRDLWDIHYLADQRSITVDWDLVRKKVVDYGGEVSGAEEVLEHGLEKAQKKIRMIGGSTMETEMGRFLPPQVLELYRPSFDSILGDVLGIITDTNADPSSQ